MSWPGDDQPAEAGAHLVSDRPAIRRPCGLAIVAVGEPDEAGPVHVDPPDPGVGARSPAEREHRAVGSDQAGSKASTLFDGSVTGVTSRNPGR
jgi:hypothetical protein